MRRKSIDPVLALAKQVELAEKEGQYLSRTVRKGHFQYSGNQTRFVERVNALTDKERRDIVEASIILTGNKVKPENKCCYYATLLLGVVFVVPLFFMCCSWWQRMAYPAYEVDVESYQLLAKLLLSTDASGLSLTVYDNAFGRQKIKILEDLLKNTKIKSFTFHNKAAAFDHKEQESSAFRQSVQPIKQILLINSRLQWNEQLI